MSDCKEMDSMNTNAKMWLVRAEVRREAEEVVGPVDLQRLRVFSAPQRRTWSTSGEPYCAIAGVARALQTSVALKNEKTHLIALATTTEPQPSEFQVCEVMSVYF